VVLNPGYQLAGRQSCQGNVVIRIEDDTTRTALEHSEY
jgi:hypothetical protein